MIIAFGMSFVYGEIEGFLAVLIVCAMIKTIYGMFNNKIDESSFSKSILRAWAWVVLYPIILYTSLMAIYALGTFILNSDIIARCSHIITTNESEILVLFARVISKIVRIYLELIYNDFTTLGAIIACTGVFVYLVNAVACLVKKMFKEFLMLHLVMPLTGLFVLMTEVPEYFMGIDKSPLGLLILIYIIAFIVCLFRKKFPKSSNFAFSIILINTHPLISIRNSINYNFVY